jgi:hypothetical protein
MAYILKYALYKYKSPQVQFDQTGNRFFFTIWFTGIEKK